VETPNPHSDILPIPSESPAEPELGPCGTPIPNHKEALEIRNPSVGGERPGVLRTLTAVKRNLPGGLVTPTTRCRGVRFRQWRDRSRPLQLEYF